MTRRAILLLALAVLGIAATAAVAWTASQLAGQRIGLSSEPLSVASGLAPGPDRAAVQRRPAPASRVRPAAARPRATATTAASAPASPASSAPPAATGAPVAPSAPSGSTSSPSGAAASAQAKPRDDSGGGSRDSGAQRDD